MLKIHQVSLRNPRKHHLHQRRCPHHHMKIRQHQNPHLLLKLLVFLIKKIEVAQCKYLKFNFEFINSNTLSGS